MTESATPKSTDRPARFLCPGCAEEIEVLPEHFGQKVECSLCHRRFKADVRKDIELREGRRKAELERQERDKQAHLAAQQREAEEQRTEQQQQAAELQETRTPTWPQRQAHTSMWIAALWVLAVAFFIVGGLMLALYIFYGTASYVGVDPDPLLGFGALACLGVGLLACILIQLAAIRRTMQRGSVKSET